jgi:hypothetical protein
MCVDNLSENIFEQNVHQYYCLLTDCVLTVCGTIAHAESADRLSWESSAARVLAFVPTDCLKWRNDSAIFAGSRAPIHYVKYEEAVLSPRHHFTWSTITNFVS